MSFGPEYWRSIAVRAETDLEKAVARAEAAEAERDALRALLERAVEMVPQRAEGPYADLVVDARRALSEQEPGDTNDPVS